MAALRKPSVAAWAVNQLVRTQRRAVAELFEAGDALRAAHENVLAGRADANELRAAVERERAAVDALTGAARGLLTSQGHELSQTIIDRVADTLHAAALDDDARSQVIGRPPGARAAPRRSGHGGGGPVAGAGPECRAQVRHGSGGQGRRGRSSEPPTAPRRSRPNASEPRPERPPAPPSGRPAGASSGRSARPTRQRSAGTAPPRRSRTRRPSCPTPRRSSRRRTTSSGRPSRRCASWAVECVSVEQRDDDQHDHHQPEPGRRHADRSLAPPELGLGAIAGVMTLGRGTDPVIVVVVRAHTSSL